LFVAPFGNVDEFGKIAYWGPRHREIELVRQEIRNALS
jgi:uncharacterized protein YqgQ